MEPSSHSLNAPVLGFGILGLGFGILGDVRENPNIQNPDPALSLKIRKFQAPKTRIPDPGAPNDLKIRNSRSRPGGWGSVGDSRILSARIRKSELPPAPRRWPGSGILSAFGAQMHVLCRGGSRGGIGIGESRILYAQMHTMHCPCAPAPGGGSGSGIFGLSRIYAFRSGNRPSPLRQ